MAHPVNIPKFDIEEEFSSDHGRIPENLVDNKKEKKRAPTRAKSLSRKQAKEEQENLKQLEKQEESNPKEEVKEKPKKENPKEKVKETPKKEDSKEEVKEEVKAESEKSDSDDKRKPRSKKKDGKTEKKEKKEKVPKPTKTKEEPKKEKSETPVEDKKVSTEEAEKDEVLESLNQLENMKTENTFTIQEDPEQTVEFTHVITITGYIKHLNDKDVRSYEIRVEKDGKLEKSVNQPVCVNNKDNKLLAFVAPDQTAPGIKEILNIWKSEISREALQKGSSVKFA